MNKKWKKYQMLKFKIQALPQKDKDLLNVVLKLYKNKKEKSSER